MTTHPVTHRGASRARLNYQRKLMARMAMRKVVLGVLLLFTRALMAQDCESVIALSKTVSVVVEDQRSVEAAAANFCSAYSKSTSSGTSANLGISYGLLSGSFGSSSVDAAAVASRYCSVQNTSQARADAYQRYVESISPDAYRAYEVCVKYSEQELKFSLDPATVLPNQFTVIALYASKAKNAKTALAFSASDDVTCAWVGNKGEQAELASGSTAALKCTRSDSERKSYVSVFSPELAIEAMNIPWQAYTKEGVSIDMVAALQARLGTMETQLAQLRSRTDSLASELDTVEGQIPNAIVWAADAHHPPAVINAVNHCDIGDNFMMGVALNGLGNVTGLSCRRAILTRR